MAMFMTIVMMMMMTMIIMKAKIVKVVKVMKVTVVNVKVMKVKVVKVKIVKVKIMKVKLVKTTSRLMEQNLESAPMHRKTCSSDGFPCKIGPEYLEERLQDKCWKIK